MKTVLARALGLIASSVVAGVAGAQSVQAVEWKVSDGGNGHWYAVNSWPTDTRWLAAKQFAESVGGHLATITNSAEDDWTTALVTQTGGSWNGVHGPWIGAFASAPCTNGSACFQWVTGEPFIYTRWHPGNPDNVTFAFYPGLVAISLWEPNWTRAWQDLSQGETNDWRNTRSALIEWSADCNGDGIVDYGQIKSGQLADDNANGVPDICELSVTGVVPPSVPSQGGSTITIKGNNFPENSVVLVGGLPVTNVVRVSATRITAVSPALLPGMVAVKVNDFTLEEALYIRPECGSDLDQDGEVTASDIAIVLLDFGPCYATAPSSQPADSTPFLLKEEPVLGTLGAR